MDLYKTLKHLYQDKADKIYKSILNLIEKEKVDSHASWLNASDVMLITYGDSIMNQSEKPLQTLHHFLNKYLKSHIPNVHLLPMYPYTSDDGFSVVDYEKINPDLGSWDDIKELSKDFDLMYDGVINHISKESAWVKGYLADDKTYQNFFIPCDPKSDYSMVTRPRALPLYYPYPSKTGTRYLWATFSEDQIDLNYKEPQVLLRILEILIFYAKNGARFIRMDAIGFLWKKLGTSCIHLEETHMIIQVIRYVMDQTVPHTLLISETNVPHQENISYFGQNNNEASLVYQFPLPPLVLYTFIHHHSHRLISWIKSLDETPLHPKNTYFNFLASHDGIGVRPVEGLLSVEEKESMIAHVLNAGGRISYKNNPNGTKSPYEMNISYVDAIIYGEDETLKVDKFIASQAILVFLKGMPGIYIHSLLGTRNDMDGLLTSGINRRINRKKLKLNEIEHVLSLPDSFESKILAGYLKLIQERKSYRAFSPDASQEAISMDDRLIVLKRKHPMDTYAIYVIVNVSNQHISLNLPFDGFDLVSNKEIHQALEIKPYAYHLIKVVL